MSLNAALIRVTERIVERSRATRAAYVARMQEAGARRETVDCSNLAHGIAACPAIDKAARVQPTSANIAIVTAYNDMLSAHQPFERFPDLLKAAAREAGAVAQVAGGVPAMCDGVTQGRDGMELSLFSRDVIALATAIALSHDLFDAGLLLGVCDKIVPGLLIGALSFGHLPMILVPAGPHGIGACQCRKGAHTPSLCRKPDRARGSAGSRAAKLSQPRHLHLLRHCQFQSVADGNDGAASAGRGLCQSRHPLARGADQGGGAPGGAHDPQGRGTNPFMARGR